MMASAPPWGEAVPAHYVPMNAAAGSDLPDAPLAGHLLGRLVRFVLAALVAASAILLAG